MRLDAYLVESGAFESRTRAQAAIRAGLVRIDGAVATKPAQAVAPMSSVEIDGDIHPYVSSRRAEARSGATHDED